MLRYSGRLLDTVGCNCRGSMEIAIDDGIVTQLAPGAAQEDAYWLMAPFANGHDHVRAIRPAALGGFDLPLELWLTHMTNVPPVDPHLTASLALGRQVLGGIGSIMVHYTRPVDRARVNDELEVVANAARSIGVRVGIAVAMRDINPLGYGPDAQLLAGLSGQDQQLIRDRLMAAPRTPAEQIRDVERLAERIEGPLVTVQFGPYGMEWCSRALLAAIAENSARSGRRVHMHLLESHTQRQYLDHVYPEGPIHFLDSIGLLSPRLSVAHAIWLRPEEMELLAMRGVTVAVNASSNLTLRSGIAPVTELHRKGVDLAMGMDGFSFDDDDDAFRELRLNYLLHRGRGLEDGIPVDDLLRVACYGGRRSVTGIEAGKGIETGGHADLMVLDRTAATSDQIIDDNSDAHLLARRGTAAMVRHLVVAGREIARDGQLTGIDLAEVKRELDQQVRHGAEDFRNWTDVSTRLRAQLKQFYAAGLHYCG